MCFKIHTNISLGAVVLLWSALVKFLRIPMILFQIASQLLFKDVKKGAFSGKPISSLKVMLKSVIVIVMFAVVCVYKTTVTS